MLKKNITLRLKWALLSFCSFSSITSGLIDDLQENLALIYGKQYLAQAISNLREQSDEVNTQIPDSQEISFIQLDKFNQPSPTELIEQSAQLKNYSKEIGRIVRVLHTHFPREPFPGHRRRKTQEKLCDFYNIFQTEYSGYEKRKHEIEESPFFNPNEIVPYLFDPTPPPGSSWYFVPRDNSHLIAGLGSCWVVGTALKSYVEKLKQNNQNKPTVEQAKFHIKDFCQHLGTRLKKVRQDDNKIAHGIGLGIIGLAIGILVARLVAEPYLLHKHEIYEQLNDNGLE